MSCPFISFLSLPLILITSSPSCHFLSFLSLHLHEDSKAVLFLVLEYVNGGELFDRMKRTGGGPGIASEEFARRYFCQLLSGIDYCHGKGKRITCNINIIPSLLLIDPFPRFFLVNIVF